MKLSEAFIQQSEVLYAAAPHRTSNAVSTANLHLAHVLFQAIGNIIEQIEKGEITDIYNPSDIDNLS